MAELVPVLVQAGQSAYLAMALTAVDKVCGEKGGRPFLFSFRVIQLTHDPIRPLRPLYKHRLSICSRRSCHTGQPVPALELISAKPSDHEQIFKGDVPMYCVLLDKEKKKGRPPFSPQTSSTAVRAMARDARMAGLHPLEPVSAKPSDHERIEG